MNMRTPLAQVRGLGSAKNGTRHWWLQRVTAIALIPLMIWFLLSVLSLVGADHEVVVAWLRQPLVAVPMLLLLGVMFFHLRLGLQVVVEDYVHQEGAKIAALLIISFGTVVLAAASMFAVLTIALGG